VFLFLFKLGSRRQIDFLFHSPEFVGNLAACSGQELARTPAGDTLAYLCERLSPHALSEVRVAMVRDLIRSRALDSQRICGGRWAIALDGTGLLQLLKASLPPLPGDDG